jgi:REP element-mobilizing transposase RayT
MPRRKREEEPGALHHVFAHAIGAAFLFRDDEDRRVYLELLERTILEFGWHCMSLCLMGTHMHFLVETPRPNLWLGMQCFHNDYAKHYNRRHGGKGHVFRERYKSKRVKTDAQFWAVVRYIALNPVEAGLCGKPEEWPWGSHRAVVDGIAPAWLDVDRLLWYFGANSGDPRARYRAFVEAA